MAIENFSCVAHAMFDVKIERLGALGDGIGRIDGSPVYVPQALPGEVVKASGEPPHLDLVEIVSAAQHRQTPPCPHFTDCGGCTFQHATLEFLADWKQHEVKLAFSKAGIKQPVEETIMSPPASRRRVTFSAKRDGSDVVLGFISRQGETLVDVHSCTILLPQLEREIPNFRNLVKTLIRGSEIIQLAINVCDNGLDIDVLLQDDPSEEMISAFVRLVAKSSYLRASLNGEIMVEKEKPSVWFGPASVAVPPGGFLQAVKSAERAMVEIVSKHLAKSKKIVDLFCGSGTFSLPLARKSKIHCVEMNQPALDALLASSGTEGLKSITVEQRDLFEQPLTSGELKPFDGVCLDPPRAGAQLQIEQIAKADIRRIAYVSCNPVTLAEDAKRLIDAGYELEQITPIDQFIYSPHIEVIALFSKKAQKSKRSIFR